MKKLIFLIPIFLLALPMMAQRGEVQTLTVDTVKGAETVNFDFAVTKAGVDVVFQAVATNIGGTTNERGYLKFSVDGTTYVTFADAQYSSLVDLFATDSSKIANNGNVWTATTANGFGGVIYNCPYKYLRVAMVGESGDTTSYTVKWAYK